MLGGSQSHAQDVGAQAPAPEVPAKDNDIVVYGRAIEQIGSATSGSEGTVGYRDFEDKPLSRVGELAENVPGLIATQHSGTGKANQYFLRGFNLDHGTDLAGFIDGVPINMRTHGHGQGYLDLNFLIPELIERIDYRKGPYFADVGDFSAAGTVKFKTVDTMKPMAEATVGSFGYYRLLAAGSTPVADGNLLLAVDGTLSNGPWVLDENLRKINGQVKFSRGTTSEGWSIGVNAYRATWTSTDQIPERAVAAGTIDRFGYIDPYLGGETTRVGLTANAAFGQTRATAYVTYYKFRLTSNFAYFLDDPVDGDEFQQRDRRLVVGGSIDRKVEADFFGIPVSLTIGADGRWDWIGNIGLYHSKQGIVTSPVREDAVSEYSAGLYAEAAAALTPSLRMTLALRGDLYGLDVDAGMPVNSGRGTDALLQPKVRLAWRPAKAVEFYADYGTSYHSNDVRGATIRIDPQTGAPADPVQVLVPAHGGEIGVRAETAQFSGSVVAYYLNLGSELVFVGDAGTTEPNAASRRIGMETTAFWRPTNWLALDGSFALTRARFTGVPAGEDRIPNSTGNVIAAGAEFRFTKSATASLRVRHFGSAPLIEDDSARSQLTTLLNLGAYNRFGRVKLGVEVLNLLDAKDADITYYYASRLPSEPAGGVDDYHFHPVEPRQVRLSVRMTF